jgi:hypothetical protein
VLARAIAIAAGCAVVADDGRHRTASTSAAAGEDVDRASRRSEREPIDLFGREHLGDKLDAQKLHDAILAQGLLPPDLLRKAELAAVQ